MSQNIAVNFKVSGTELSAYINEIQNKANKLTDSAIKSAQDQTKAGREQIKIIGEQIDLLEKKTRLEAQAARAIVRERNEAANRQRTEIFESKKNEVYANPNLSEKDKKERVTAIEGREKAASEEQKNAYRDQVAAQREQERQNKIIITLSREQIQEAKLAAKEQIKAINNEGKTLSDVYREVGNSPTQEEKLTLGLMEEELAEQKKAQKKGAVNDGFLAAQMVAGNISQIASGLSSLSETTNGFDTIKAKKSMAGQIIGTIVGTAIGALIGPEGALFGAGVGGQVLSSIMGAEGGLEQKQALLTQENLREKYKYYALTGMKDGNINATDMASVGVDATSFIKMQSDFARKRGFAGDSEITARQASYLDRGFGVDQSTSGAAVEMLRSSKEGNRDLAGLITGILQKGQGRIFKNGDNTFLNEFTGKFITLQKELLKNNTTIATGTTMDILSKFNSLGGMFEARDSRSAGLISSIDGSLSSPGSDNIRALEYGILHRQKPGAGIFDLRKEMQKGLGSPGLLKGMLDAVFQMGGGEDAILNNLSGMLPGLPLEAIESIYKGYKGGKLSKFDTPELNSIGLSNDVIKGRAEDNTSPIDKITAENLNKTLSGQPLQAAADAIAAAMKESLSGAVIELENGKLTLLSKAGVVKANETRKAGEQKKLEETPIIDRVGFMP